MSDDAIRQEQARTRGGHDNRHKQKRRAVGAIFVTMLLIAASCGGDDDAAPAVQEPAAEEPAAEEPAAEEPAAEEPAAEEPAAEEPAAEEPAAEEPAAEEPAAEEPAADPAAAGVAYARSQIEAFTPYPSEGFEAPGPPIAGDVSSLAGEEVWFVPLAFAAIPFFESFRLGMQDAFATVGITVRLCDGAGNPASWSACIDDAAAQEAGGVVLGAISPFMAERSVESALEAGVPVLVSNQGYPEASTQELAYVSFDTDAVLRLAADWVIMDSGGDATIVITRITDSAWTANAIDNGALPEFAEYCPGCTVEVVDINFANVPDMASAVAAAFTRNPDINYVMPQYTSVIPFVLQGTQTAGYEDKVRGATTTGVLDGLQRVAAQDFIHAEVGINIYQEGWISADQLIRMMLGEDPLQNLDVPFRVFTEDNVGDLELTPEAFHSGVWYGDTGFREVYQELWGVG